MNAILIVLPILTLLMFDIGLTLRADDFRLLSHRPLAVLAGLIGQLVLLALIAFLLTAIFGLEPVFALGIILIACCPGGSSSNVFSMLAGGDVALSVSLTALSSVLTLFTIPLILQFACQFISGLSTADVSYPFGGLIMQNLVLSLLPIAIGAFVRHRWRSASATLHTILSKAAFPLLLVLATVFFFQHRETIVATFPRLGLIISLLIILAMLGGRLLAFVLRLTRRESTTIVIEVGMQNAAQAIAIASSPFVFANSRMAIPAIIYALIMNVILLAYVAKKMR